MSNFYLMLIAGGGVTALLFVYACFLAYKLKDKDKRRSQPIEFKPKSESQLDAQLSIRVIAQALLQNDLSPTEAAMRIGFLAQQLNDEFKQDQSIKVFETLAMEASHLPILDAWKSLPKDEKLRLKKERLTIESKHAEQINIAAKALATVN